MSYPGQDQGGYGQPDYGQQPQYGQEPQYGQQDYSQPQYGQQDYSQQYGQGQYGQPQYGAAPSQGLPAITPKILAAVVGGFGVLQLFLGFLGAADVKGSSDGPKLFESQFVAPYLLVVVAGLLALTTLLGGASKETVAIIASLNVVAVFVTIFQFASMDGDAGGGAIVLLIFSILLALVSVFWLVVAAGFVKVAPAAAAAPAPYQG